MPEKVKVLIVLDDLKYVSKQSELTETLKDICSPIYFYSTYENRLIRFFHGLPKIGNFLSHIGYWTLSFNSALKLFFGQKKIENKIFINPIVAIFYSFLVSLTQRKENVIIAGFLFEEKANPFYYKLRKKFVDYCYKSVSKIIVYSKNEVEVYANLFPTLANKFTFILYGRDYDIFEENEFISQIPYIGSGGISNRDFGTLVKAFEILKSQNSNIHCKIATRPEGCALQPELPNLEILYNIRLDRFGSFIQKSSFFIIPLANTSLSAGHMALLEAMYREKIILITDIPSVRDYVNDDLVYFYEPDNPVDLANKIKEINANSNKDKAENAKNYFKANYSFESLLFRIVNSTIN